MPQLFDSLSSSNRQQRQLAHDACEKFNRAPSKGHLKSLKSLFKFYGSDLRIEAGFRCDYGNKISFGDRCYVNFDCCFLDGGEINLGDDLLIGPKVQIITINHDVSPEKRLNKHSYVENVTIGNNVWIGAGAIILPGVTIGDNSVIAAGSVVNRSVEENSLVAGNPAAFKKRL